MEETSPARGLRTWSETKQAATWLAIVENLVDSGWVNDHRIPPQSDSAQAFANEVFDRYPGLQWEERYRVTTLATLIRKYNWDPATVNLVGAVLALLEYIRSLNE